MSPLLFALFLATFAIGTTEFAVVGLLPDIAANLDDQHLADRPACQRLCDRRGGRRPGHCRAHVVAAAQADASATLRDLRRGSCAGCACAGLWLADEREGARGGFARLLPRHCGDRGGGERSAGAQRSRGVFRVAGLLRREPRWRAERDRDRPRVWLARRLLDARGGWGRRRGGASALDARVFAQRGFELQTGSRRPATPAGAVGHGDEPSRLRFDLRRFHLCRAAPFGGDGDLRWRASAYAVVVRRRRRGGHGDRRTARRLEAIGIRRRALALPTRSFILP